jgi:uncharacterized metal-binding protein YceD (DUF177 family)
MKIHLKQIPPDGLHLEGEEKCPIPELEAEGIRCAGPLSYALDLGISEGALWANGTLSQPVELRCVSCLEPFIYNIEVRSFALHTELSGPEQLDLTPYLREDVLLNLPPYPHCDRDGNRVCKAAEVANAAAAKPESVSNEPPPAWSELDKLKLKK